MLAFFMIWKVLVPGCLPRLDPLFLSIAVLLFLNCSTILLVSGVGEKELCSHNREYHLRSLHMHLRLCGNHVVPSGRCGASHE
ncbi:MAG: hypothetical protein MR563_08850 [Spirochaetales bacterium]|nr:hypothetical protein [Spirochaetales bacterium]